MFLSLGFTHAVHDFNAWIDWRVPVSSDDDLLSAPLGLPFLRFGDPQGASVLLLMIDVIMPLSSFICLPKVSLRSGVR
jgi:hypothetical protein